MHAIIFPNVYVALRLPSDTLKVLQIVPNTTISIGKYGTFQANHILGRPYHLTFEILDETDDSVRSGLRIVPAAELYADITEGELKTSAGIDDGKVIDGKDGVEYEVVTENGEVVMRTNCQTVDDPASQVMSQEEIEALKREGTGSGKDLIAKILESHSALDQKTAFALAKYTLRKAKKYMRRFTVLPVDVPLLTHWIMTEKEPMKIMELREEMLALVGSWSNVHFGGSNGVYSREDGTGQVGGGRWLIVDETGGLVVAAMAEKMGILYPPESDQPSELIQTVHEEFEDGDTDIANGAAEDHSSGKNQSAQSNRPKPTRQSLSMSAPTNTLTVIHANSQPNLSLLKYFLFDSTNPSSSHPLNSHLKTVSWLQLLSPSDDAGYAEPEVVPDDILKSYKSGKRGNYYRKRRRWERIKSVVDESRAGGYDGLIVASFMDPFTILHHAVPLLRGGAQVVVYSPNVEPLAELADCYSTSRRTAFLNNPLEVPNEDFPLNPTLLLAPTIQTARCRNWQVLPGRTHPLMTGRGGAEGYIFTATRVLPAEGKVEARGRFKRRKAGDIGKGYEASSKQDPVNSITGQTEAI
ncbi:S-adenosyl-L-methionine-dependent methyltransferase-like [Lasallia pustulata]|uniref:tRNA (adenine(58)-N(1))-methyltransferase non-catalytic subunit TRM6 n=1 Tax=Lasallia pustulata TaxID=136370 RepID=A0A1W5D9B8_9LECA|nr:S-adenosyl-L-methionine-dependent methyltransferase-like [Lasallia pustulata]